MKILLTVIAAIFAAILAQVSLCVHAESVELIESTESVELTEFTLRVSDWKTGVIYSEVPAKAGSKLFFGWIHSLEKIPWNEYYHIAEDGALILDSVTFPAFGAGIPENKGKVCYIENGLIHMEKIDQTFEELVWLNSHTATQEILLDGEYVTRGSDLPHHARLRLVIGD
ncbi:MAG: DUF1850 domain-containing protein [Synergistaceae bacterium]|nr:DUF1850 domain-containing protein [Synergistaceae bacterium]